MGVVSVPTRMRWATGLGILSGITDVTKRRVKIIRLPKLGERGLVKTDNQVKAEAALARW